GETELVLALREAWKRYREAYVPCTARPAAAVAECYFAELEPRFRRTKGFAESVLLLNQDAMAEKSDRAQRKAAQAVATGAAAALAPLGLGIGATAWLARRTIRPLAVLTQAVDAFGRGDLA